MIIHNSKSENDLKKLKNSQHTLNIKNEFTTTITASYSNKHYCLLNEKKKQTTSNVINFKMYYLCLFLLWIYLPIGNTAPFSSSSLKRYTLPKDKNLTHFSDEVVSIF